MSGEIIDVVRSLTSVMRDETRLLASGRRGELGELVSAKLRLTACLEREIAILERDDPKWQEQMSEAERSDFAETIEEMQAVATENGQRLLRQIELSRDLMEAIVIEARRLEGHRSDTYGAAGGLQRVDLPAPIAINTRL